MKTAIVRFKVLRGSDVLCEDVEIQHDFEIIPKTFFHGVVFSETSIEYQVIEMLDTMDKRDMMIERDWDTIFDYWCVFPINKEQECEEFYMMIEPWLKENEEIRNPFDVVVQYKFDEIFGHDFSIKEKFEKIIKYLDVALKGYCGGMAHVIDDLNKQIEPWKKKVEEERKLRNTDSISINKL